MLKRLLSKIQAAKVAKEGLDVVGFALATAAVFIAFGLAPALGVAAVGCVVTRALMD